MAALEPYYFTEPNAETDSSEDSEVDNRLEKIHFFDLVKDAKVSAGDLLPKYNIETRLCVSQLVVDL